MKKSNTIKIREKRRKKRKGRSAEKITGKSLKKMAQKNLKKRHKKKPKGKSGFYLINFNVQKKKK